MTTMVLKSDVAADLKPFETLAKKLGIIVEYVKEKSTKKENYRGRGSLKGKICMSSDFDEPLEFAQQPKRSAEKKDYRGYGSLKGLWMAPDFDEPLEDFKDYM
jgi:hypothetical protein